MFVTDFNNLSGDQYQFKEIYLSTEPYLSAFCKPVLLHGDISSENIRVLDGHLNGVIDYADCLCGDGLYDIGRFLVFLKGEWKYIDAMALGYKSTHGEKQWSKKERECIRFYACYFALRLKPDDDTVRKLLLSIADGVVVWLNSDQKRRA